MLINFVNCINKRQENLNRYFISKIIVFSKIVPYFISVITICMCTYIYIEQKCFYVNYLICVSLVLTVFIFQAAFVVALCNLSIPINLQHVINTILQFARNEVQYDFEKLAKPLSKLVVLYLTQVII